ncbi:MAG TPA: hypothetical protein VII94_02300 [Candidatus Saccharimonadales bacterium]
MPKQIKKKLLEEEFEIDLKRFAEFLYGVYEDEQLNKETKQ